MKYPTRLAAWLLPAGVLFAHGPAEPDWRTVNDTVMGGVSTGSATPLPDGVARFAGILSLENNGGFASIRADSPEFAFGSDGTLVLRVRGDGRDYTVDLRTARRQGAFSYKQGFQTRAGEEMDIRLPLSGFRPTAFGRSMPLAAPLDPAAVVSLGFMIADKRPGPFRLDVLSIGFEAASPPRVEGPSDLIRLAIQRGVPLFNRGDADACAAVYETTAHALLLLPDSSVPPDMKDSLRQDLENLTKDGSAVEKAWAYRRALDRVHQSLQQPAER